MATTKQELTGAFLEKELTATDIKNIVNANREFFKSVGYIGMGDLITSNLTTEQLSFLDTNIKKINLYYKMGEINNFLFPKIVNPFSTDAFKPTGHNNLEVRPMKKLALEFIC